MDDYCAVWFGDEEEARRCAGKFVAMRSFQDRKVIRNGNGEPIVCEYLGMLMDEIYGLGYKNPVVIFIPEAENWIYSEKQGGFFVASVARK